MPLAALAAALFLSLQVETSAQQAGQPQVASPPSAPSASSAGAVTPAPDARRLLDAGGTAALASNCNPGSSYTTSMPFCIALAVRDMHMTIDEAVWAATAGGATALRRDDIGTLAAGKRADLVILDTCGHLPTLEQPEAVADAARSWLLRDIGAMP